MAAPAPVFRDREEALQEIRRLQIPLADWETVEREIAEAHGCVPGEEAGDFSENE